MYVIFQRSRLFPSLVILSVHRALQVGKRVMKGSAIFQRMRLGPMCSSFHHQGRMNPRSQAELSMWVRVLRERKADAGQSMGTDVDNERQAASKTLSLLS